MIHRTLNQLTVLAAAVGIFAGCRNESRFSTGNGHYEGQVVSGTFVRANVVDGTLMCLTLDTNNLQGSPGIISSSDGRFTSTPLRQIPQIWQDPLSTLQFGEGREKNLIYMAAPQATTVPERADVTVVLSLMDSGDTEVRLVRGAPPDVSAGNATSLPSAIFGVFTLTQRAGPCPTWSAPDGGTDAGNATSDAAPP